MVGRADLVYFFVSDMDRAVAFYREHLSHYLEDATA